MIEFQEDVTFIEWFYNVIMSTWNLVLTLKEYLICIHLLLCMLPEAIYSCIVIFW